MNNPPEKTSHDRNIVDREKLNHLVRYINTLIIEGDYSSDEPTGMLDKMLHLIYSSGVSEDVAIRIEDILKSKSIQSTSIDDQETEELISLCKNNKEKDSLIRLIGYLHGFVQRRDFFKKGGSKRERHRNDIMTLVETGPFHWKVVNFFRYKLRHFLYEPLSVESVIEEFDDYWKNWEKKSKQRKETQLQDTRLLIEPQDDEESEELPIHSPQPVTDEPDVELDLEDIELDPNDDRLRVLFQTMGPGDKWKPEVQMREWKKIEMTEGKIEESLEVFGDLKILKKIEGGKYVFNCKKSDGSLMSEEWFSGIRFNEEGAVVTFKDGKENIISPKGEFLLKENCDWAGLFYEKRARVSINKKWHFIREDGSFLLSDIAEKIEGAKVEAMSMRLKPLQFDKAEDFKNGFAEVELDGEEFKIDMNGKRYEIREEAEMLPKPHWLKSPEEQEAIPLSGTADEPPAIPLPGTDDNLPPLVVDKKDGEGAEKEASPFEQPIPDVSTEKNSPTPEVVTPSIPDFGRNEFIKAEECRKKEKYAKAIEYYEKAIKSNCINRLEALNRIAVCHYKLEAYDKAIEYFCEALNVSVQIKEINNIYKLIYKTLMKMNPSDPSRAIDKFEGILRKFNKEESNLDEELLKVLSKDRIKAQESSMHETLTLVIMSEPSDGELRKKAEEVCDEYRQLVSQNPNHKFSHREMARKLRMLYDEGKVEIGLVFEVHEMDLENNPDHFASIASIAETHFAIGGYESLVKAAEYFMRVLALESDDSATNRPDLYQVLKKEAQERLSEIPKKMSELIQKGPVPTIRVQD